MGIGPTQSAWKAEILPLNYTRIKAFEGSCNQFKRLKSLPYTKLYVNKMQQIFTIYFIELI